MYDVMPTPDFSLFSPQQWSPALILLWGVLNKPFGVSFVKFSPEWVGGLDVHFLMNVMIGLSRCIFKIDTFV